MMMCDMYDGLTVLYHNNISWMGNYANGKYMSCIMKNSLTSSTLNAFIILTEKNKTKHDLINNFFKTPNHYVIGF